MLEEIVYAGLSALFSNPSVFFALTSSIMILLFALVMSNNLKTSESRIIFIVIPVALGTYLVSFSFADLERDFFQNLSTEFIGALLALVLFADWITSNEYTFPVVTVLIFVVAGVFVWQASTTGDGFYTNLSTELLGALITTAVVRHDWLWSASTEAEESHSEKHSRFQLQRRNIELETAKRLSHMMINLSGKTSYEIDKRQKILSESVEIKYEGDYSKRWGGGVQRTLYANCRPIELHSVTHEHVMVILDGHEKAVNRATTRLTETFDVQKSDKELTRLSIERTQRRLQVKTPVQSFEQELHDMINLFVTRWQDSDQPTDQPTDDFAEGYHKAIQYVCDDLLTIIKNA
jgi:hypothetical protein